MVSIDGKSVLLNNDNKLIKLVPGYFLRPTEKFQLSIQHLGCPSDAGFILKIHLSHIGLFLQEMVGTGEEEIGQGRRRGIGEEHTHIQHKHKYTAEQQSELVSEVSQQINAQLL